MLIETRVLRKLLSAVGAMVTLLVAMEIEMGIVGAAHNKGASTIGADLIAYIEMRAQMTIAFVSRIEGLVAATTWIIPLALMPLDMLIQLAGINESPGAMLTHVGQLFGMAAHMDTQRGGIEELLGTLGAGVCALAKMPAQMCEQAGAQREFHGADVAYVLERIGSGCGHMATSGTSLAQLLLTRRQLAQLLLQLLLRMHITLMTQVISASLETIRAMGAAKGRDMQIQKFQLLIVLVWGFPCLTPLLCQLPRLLTLSILATELDETIL